MGGVSIYFGTFQNACVFEPNAVILCNQNVRAIVWSTVEGRCDDAMMQLLRTLSKKPTQYSHAEFMNFLEERLKEALSLCHLAIQTDSNILTFFLYGEKTLQFTLGSGETSRYQLDVPPSPTYRLPPDTILKTIDAGLLLLPATTPEELEKQLLKIELFGNGVLTPVSC